MTEEVYGEDIRTLWKAGGSLVLSLPKEYVEAHGLKEGDKVRISFNQLFLGEIIRIEDIKKKFKKD